MNTLAERYQDVQARVKAAAQRRGTDPAGIVTVAVSKTVEPQIIKTAVECGLTDFGENRVQELLRKQAVVAVPRWHLIGRLQTNKVKDVLGRVHLIHSLDRWELAEYIEKRAVSSGVQAHCLLEVNVSGESAKAGVSVAEASRFLSCIYQLPHIKIKGLMTVAPEEDNPERNRPVFKELKNLFDDIDRLNLPGVAMDFLSMGMTQDFGIAIEEGSNMIRVGRALFGPR